MCGAYQTLGITQGNGERDALWQAADCLEEAIAGRVAGGREIPKASKAARGERLTPVRAPMAAKAVLYLAMREAVALHLQGMREDGETIPQPTTQADEIEAA